MRINSTLHISFFYPMTTTEKYMYWGYREVGQCWVNFQCRGVLLIRIIVGQGPTTLAVGAGGVVLDIFSLVYNFSLLSPSPSVGVGWLVVLGLTAL